MPPNSPHVFSDGRFRRRCVALLALAALMLSASGCKKARDVASVYGKVTFNGAPVTEGLIIFQDKENAVLATAKIQPNGSYRVKVMEGDGLYVGEYEIRVSPPVLTELEMSKTAQKPPNSANIPVRYRSFQTSKLRLSVRPGDNPMDIDMTP